jgi:hypothetical protein
MSNKKDSTQKCGHWLINPDGWYPYCSECRYEPKNGELTKFCPNCGAKMNKKEE